MRNDVIINIKSKHILTEHLDDHMLWYDQLENSQMNLITIRITTITFHFTSPALEFFSFARRRIE